MRKSITYSYRITSEENTNNNVVFGGTVTFTIDHDDFNKSFYQAQDLVKNMFPTKKIFIHHLLRVYDISKLRLSAESINTTVKLSTTNV